MATHITVVGARHGLVISHELVGAVLGVVLGGIGIELRVSGHILALVFAARAASYCVFFILPRVWCLITGGKW